MEADCKEQNISLYAELKIWQGVFRNKLDTKVQIISSEFRLCLLTMISSVLASYSGSFTQREGRWPPGTKSTLLLILSNGKRISISVLPPKARKLICFELLGSCAHHWRKHSGQIRTWNMPFVMSGSHSLS